MKSPVNFWPLGIILAFVVFLGGTAGLIVMACWNSDDLVSANYYDEEIRFQAEIDRADRARRLAEPIGVTYDATRSRVVLALPAEQVAAGLTGQVQLYRPSDARLDRRYELKPDAGGTQTLDAAGLPPGLWMVRVFWTANGIEYRHDRKLVIGGRPL